jgi:hypothetical protein
MFLMVMVAKQPMKKAFGHDAPCVDRNRSSTALSQKDDWCTTDPKKPALV